MTTSCSRFIASKAKYGQAKTNSLDRWRIPEYSCSDCDPEPDETMGYRGELLSSGGFDYMRKVVMIGAGGSGKTALVNRFLTQKFSEEYIVTIGSQFAVKTVALHGNNGRNVVVKLLVWDLAGQQRFDFIRGSYYRGSKGALLVFDTTRKSTWVELPKWIKETEDALGERIPIILLANKVDLAEERVITTEMAEEFVQEHNLNGYLETSALTGQNVEEAFYLLAKSTLL